MFLHDDVQILKQGWLRRRVDLIEQGFPIDYIHLPKLVNAYRKGRMGKNRGRRGKPDLFIFFPNGKTIMIELKIENRVLDPDQADCICKYDRMGYDTYVINDDIQEFKEIISREMGI